MKLKLLGGIVILGLALPAFAQYAGPAILSRGEAPAGMASPTVDFVVSATLTATYSTGLSGVAPANSQGQLPNVSTEGAAISVAVSGAHSWRHSHLGVSYSGAYTYYPHASTYEGISQALSIGFSHQFTRHIAFSVRESAGMFLQFSPSSVELNSSVPFDPSQNFIPTTDFYNNRTIYTTSEASLVIQKTSRLSFSMSFGYFANLRSSSALYGAAGAVATGDAQYRLSRRTTVGATYSFSHYSYSGSIGGADIHTADANLSMRLTRSTEFSAFAGASRVESSFQQTKAIDPAILAILCGNVPADLCGLSAGTFTSHTLFWGPNLGARISKSFHHGVIYATAGESITPGNGLFLTSRSETAMLGYGYSGLRRWSLNASVGYTRALSLGNVTGEYADWIASAGISRQLFKSVSFVAGGGATRYESNSFSLYNRTFYNVSVGLGYSTRDLPVRFF